MPSPLKAVRSSPVAALLSGMGFGGLVGAVTGGLMAYTTRPEAGEGASALFASGFGLVLLMLLGAFIGLFVGMALGFVEVLAAQGLSAWFQKKKLPRKDYVLEAGAGFALLNAVLVVLIALYASGSVTAGALPALLAAACTGLAMAGFGRTQKKCWPEDASAENRPVVSH